MNQLARSSDRVLGRRVVDAWPDDVQYGRDEDATRRQRLAPIARWASSAVLRKLSPRDLRCTVIRRVADLGLWHCQVVAMSGRRDHGL